MLCRYVESCGESPESLPVGPRSHECDSKQTKEMISLLRFACNTDLGPKTLAACSINENFCIAKLYQTVRIMLAVQFYTVQSQITLLFIWSNRVEFKKRPGLTCKTKQKQTRKLNNNKKKKKRKLRKSQLCCSLQVLFLHFKNALFKKFHSIFLFLFFFSFVIFFIFFLLHEDHLKCWIY